MTFYSFEELKKIVEYTNDMFSNLCKVVKKLSHDNKLNFDDWDILYIPENIDNNLNYIQTHYHCACNHLIKVRYEIKNKFNKNSFIAGSSCVDHFGEKAIKQRKILKKIHDGKKICCNTNCKSKKAICIKKVEEDLKENPEQTSFYHSGCMEKLFKKCKKCKKYKNYNCICPPEYEEIIQPIQTVEVQPIIRIEPVITTETIISFGKCKGKPISYLLKDISYCKWIIGLNDATGAIERIQEYLKTVII